MRNSANKTVEDSDHSVRYAHNLIRRLREVLDVNDIAICICRLGAADQAHNPEIVLCEIADISPKELSLAKENIRVDDIMREQKMAAIPRMLEEYSADSSTFDLLARATSGGFSEIPRENPTCLSIRIAGQVYCVEIPGLDGYYALFEMLVLENYKHVPRPVDFIYDLGANIGISAIYFNALYPRAMITCVEPSPTNLEYLKANMARNPSVISRIVPYAVAGESGKVILGMERNVSMLNSRVFDLTFEERSEVQAISLSELVPPGNYGIKLDIEGGEFDLAAHADVIRNATWILGELHYGDFSKPADKWLRMLLAEYFHLITSPPRVTSTPRCSIVSQEFQAFRKDAQGFQGPGYISRTEDQKSRSVAQNGLSSFLSSSRNYFSRFMNRRNNHLEDTK